MRVLVTGGAGLIGRAAVAQLLESDFEVVSILRKPAQSAGSSNPRLVEEIGDAGDVALLERLMPSVDSVLHLAAVPHPLGRTARELLIANSLTTIAVLEAAGQAGVHSAVIASSISILGMAWAPRPMTPLDVPITEEHPLRPMEGYSLSKQTDEAVARMMSRAWGMSIACLRFPFTQSMEVLQEARIAAQGETGQAAQSARELWAYLDLRDAAEACELAIRSMAASTEPGCEVLNVVAPDLLVDASLDELLAKWYPDFSGTVAPQFQRQPYSTQRATDQIGFTATHLVNHLALSSDSAQS